MAIKNIFVELNIFPDVIIEIVIECLYRNIQLCISTKEIPKAITFYNDYLYTFDNVTYDLTMQNIDDIKKIYYTPHKFSVFDRFAIHDDQIYVLTDANIRVYTMECEIIRYRLFRIQNPVKILIHGDYIYVFGEYNIEKIDIHGLIRKQTPPFAKKIKYCGIEHSVIFVVFSGNAFTYDLDLKMLDIYGGKYYHRTHLQIKNEHYTHFNELVENTRDFITCIDNKFFINSMHYYNEYLYVYSEGMMSIYNI